jgi:transcriptional regulator with XRE-family HTH domain
MVTNLDTEQLRTEFSHRLNKVLDDVGFDAKGSGRQVQLGKAIGLTQKGVRKWLEGEGLPELSRLVQIAVHFNVSFEWLATGRGDPYSGGANVERPLSDSAIKIAKLAETLTETQRKQLLESISAQSQQNEELLAELGARRPSQPRLVKDTAPIPSVFAPSEPSTVEGTPRKTAHTKK